MESLCINIIVNWEEGTIVILEVNSGLSAGDGMNQFCWKHNEISDTLGIMMVEYTDTSKIDEKDKPRGIVKFNNREEFRYILDKGIDFIDENKVYKVSLLNLISYEEIMKRMAEYKKEVKDFADHWQLETGYFNRDLWK